MNKLRIISSILAVTVAMVWPTAAIQAAGTDAAGRAGAAAAQQSDTVVEEIVVTAVRKKSAFERPYSSIDGKRFFAGPFGDTDYIRAISRELKHQGQMQRVVTRRIHMPHEYAGSSLARYRYASADDCGIDRFRFYEGDGNFMALGYLDKKHEIIFDVIKGGGPFASPGLWGPYDQILGKKRHAMKMIMGDASKDGMGLLKSGYAIGMKPDMPGYELRESGRIYRSAVRKTGRCLAGKPHFADVGDPLVSKK